MASPPVQASGPALAGAWSALGRAYRWAEATERGYVWLDKLGPSLLFGLVALAKAIGLAQGLGRAAAGQLDVHAALQLGFVATSCAFFALVAGLFLFRHRPLKRVGSPLQGLVALLGSYVMTPVAANGATPDDSAVLVLANLLLVVGTAGAALSVARLGRCFGIFPEARGLVIDGPYRLVRHPVYLFEFVAFLGVLIAALTPLNLLLYALFVALQLGRMTFEERVLAEAFPDQYPAYRRRTARLIPGVY